MNRYRNRLWSVGYATDVALAALSGQLGTVLAHGGGGWADGSSLPVMLAFAVAMAATLPVFGLNQTVWRWTSADDIGRLVPATLTGMFLCSALLFLADPESGSAPRAAPFLAAVCCLVLMVGARGAARAVSGGGLRALLRPVAPGAPATILIGPTDSVTAALHAERARGKPLPLRPVAIVSTSGEHVGKLYAGARVHDGLDVLPKLVADALSRNPDLRIALVGRDPGRKAARAALSTAARHQVQVMRIPGADGIVIGAVHPSEVLGRSHRDLDNAGPRRLFRHRRVLVTGAGGSIGSELARQIAALGPSRLVLIDASENNLHGITMEIRQIAPGLEVLSRLLDIRDTERVSSLFAQEKPDIVIHAAANKHVPLMEAHVCEALEVNLGGTKTVADAAMASGVGAFVFISTDKAVEPVNIMGAAKRAAEIYVRMCGEARGGGFYTVRFGNVLGSNGSVMPLFESQIAAGGPVTVTHRDMTRFFMTVEEASALVLQAAVIGHDRGLAAGARFVLDMGEPVRIVELAEAMIRMKGKEPGRDIEIAFTGLRPGERLHERLFVKTESAVPTNVDGVLMAVDTQSVPDGMAALTERVLQAARRDDTAGAVEALCRILPDFKAGDSAGAEAGGHSLTSEPALPVADGHAPRLSLVKGGQAAD